MKIDGTWVLNNIARFGPDLDFGVVPAPVPADRLHHVGRFADEKDTYITWAGGFSYAIPRGSQASAGGLGVHQVDDQPGGGRDRCHGAEGVQRDQAAAVCADALGQPQGQRRGLCEVRADQRRSFATRSICSSR